MQVYPVARHLADKVTAMYERHGAASASPSTRPHDLADIGILARSSTVDARDLLAAIRSEEQRRGVTVPSPLVLPDDLWVSSYCRRVERSGLPASLHEARSALNVANELLGPIMSGQVRDGRWDPTSLTWTAGERGVQPPLSMRMLFRAVQPRQSTSQPRQSDHRWAPQPSAPPIHEARPDTGFSLCTGRPDSVTDDGRANAKLQILQQFSNADFIYYVKQWFSCSYLVRITEPLLVMGIGPFSRAGYVDSDDLHRCRLGERPVSMLAERAVRGRPGRIEGSVDD